MRNIKLTFAGASGYGNLGDDAYKSIFSRELGLCGFECMFDSPFPDARSVSWCDALVIGGGGVVYCNNTEHFKYMSMYMDEAMKKSKRLLFSSVGCQWTPEQSKDILSALYPWVKYLDYASCITVRSEKDREILSKLTKTPIFYYPDLCYLIKECNYRLTLPDSHIYVITGMSSHDPRLFNELEQSLISKNPIYTVVMARDDEKYTRQFLERLPDKGDHYYNRDNLRPNEVAAIFKTASKVVTGRYHGRVFAHAMGCPKIISIDSRTKSLFEVVPKDKEVAYGHINKIEEVLHGLNTSH